MQRPGEEVVLDDEHARCARSPPARPRRLSGTGAVTFSSISGGMPDEDVGRDEARARSTPARMPKRASSFAHVDRHGGDAGLGGRVVALARRCRHFEMLEMLMITPPWPSLIMRSAASRPQRNTPVRLTSMTACHCVERHLADDDAVLDLDQQRVLDDAGIVHQHVEPAVRRRRLRRARGSPGLPSRR